MQPKNKSAIYTRSQSHKNNLQSQWQRKFPKTQIPTTTSINQKRIVHHGEGKNMEMLSKSARQIEEAQKSRNCLNKQGVNFPSRNKQWRVAQAQNSTGREGFMTDSTIENQKKAATSSNFRKVLWWTLTRTDFSIMYSWFVIRYYSPLTTGRCYKAIVCCKAKMCSHEILKICMCLEVAFPWKPRTRQSFRETRFKNEIFWTISGLKRLVESFNVHLKNIDELPLLLVLLSLWPCGSGKLCNCKLYV